MIFYISLTLFIRGFNLLERRVNNLNFLDVTKIVDNIIEFNWFYKPLPIFSGRYLNFHFLHPFRNMVLLLG